MKKTIAMCLALVLLLAAALPAFAAGNPNGAYVVDLEDDTGKLNVHGTPSIFNVTDRIADGTVVQYLSMEDGWWYVEWWAGNDDLRTGYVDGDYLTPIDADLSARYAVLCRVHVHSQSHIAKGECWKYHTGDLLSSGQKVYVLEQDGIWANVSFGGKTGWIPSVYLTLD